MPTVDPRRLKTTCNSTPRAPAATRVHQQYNFPRGGNERQAHAHLPHRPGAYAHGRLFRGRARRLGPACTTWSKRAVRMCVRVKICCISSPAEAGFSRSAGGFGGGSRFGHAQRAGRHIRNRHSGEIADGGSARRFQLSADKPAIRFGHHRSATALPQFGDPALRPIGRRFVSRVACGFAGNHPGAGDSCRWGRVSCRSTGCSPAGAGHSARLGQAGQGRQGIGRDRPHP